MSETEPTHEGGAHPNELDIQLTGVLNAHSTLKVIIEERNKQIHTRIDNACASFLATSNIHRIMLLQHRDAFHKATAGTLNEYGVVMK